MGYSPWGFKESDMTEKITHTKNVFMLVIFTKTQSFS